MKLSNETLVVLKNFSTINDGIKFRKGTKLLTVSQNKTVLAQANLKDEFPEDFCVHDLNQFLSVHALSDKTELSFDKSNIIFKGKSTINFRKAAENMIVAAPDRTVELPSEDVNFTLNVEDYEYIIKTGKILSSTHVAICSDGESIYITTYDASNDSSNDSNLKVGEGNGSVYKVVFDINNLKLIPGSYDVKISFGGIAHFKNTSDDIQYWIASEPKYNTQGE